MKRMELTVGSVLMVFSLYIMWKSAELPIGWIPGYGPGGGAFPFWLGLGMFACTVMIVVRTWLGHTPESRSTEPFMDRRSWRLILTVGGSLVVLIAVIGGIDVFGVPIVPALGIYVAVPLFMIFYLRYLGQHSWFATLAISLTTPVVTFLFFEKLLIILLPKGLTDEWFYIFF